MNITIVATLITKTNSQEAIEKELKLMAEESRKEEGNINYDILKNKKNNLKYIIIENWKSQEVIDLHNKSAHYINFLNAIEGKIDVLTINVAEKIF